MRKKTAAAITVALVISLALFYGCKSKTETKTQTIKTDKGTMTVKTEGEKTDIKVTTSEGETVEMKRTEGKLPENWPAELGVMEGGEVVFSQRLTEGNNVADQVHITTPASVKDVLSFYKDKLQNGGWKIEGTVEMPNMTMLNASKGNKNAMLQFMDEQGRTKAILIVSTEG